MMQAPPVLATTPATGHSSSAIGWYTVGNGVQGLLQGRKFLQEFRWHY